MFIHQHMEVMKILSKRLWVVGLDWEGGAWTDVKGQNRKDTELKTSSWTGTTKERVKGYEYIKVTETKLYKD